MSSYRGGGGGGGRGQPNPNASRGGYGGRGGGQYGGDGGGGGRGGGRGGGYGGRGGQYHGDDSGGGRGGGGGSGGGRGGGYQGQGGGGYQGQGGGGGRGGGYQDRGGRGGGGYQGRGGGRGGGDYGGGRGRGGGHGGAPPADLRQAGPPLADKYAAEAAKLREMFKGMSIHRDEPKFPARPGHGTAGTACVVRANHFFVGLVDKGLHHYDVTISPESTLKGVYRKVMKKLLDERKQTDFGGRQPAYDGRKALFTAGELPFKSREFEVTLGAERGEKRYKVMIKHATSVSLDQLRMLMAGYPTDIPAQALQVLDIVMRDIVLNERNDMEYVAVGRSFFSRLYSQPTVLGFGVEGWMGFYQSMRPTQNGLSVIIDISATPFIEPLPLIDFAMKVLNKKDLRQFTNIDYAKLKRALRGVRVEVTHRGNERRKYRINGLTLQPPRELRFESSAGVSKTVTEYFRETYQLNLQFGFLPCLNVGNEQKPNYLPLEVCQIVPGQRYQKKLEDTQVSTLMSKTCQHPQDREHEIRQAVMHNKYNSTKLANEFGIEVDNNPTSLQARVLPAPTLKYHDSGSESRCNPKDGSWNMRGKKVVNGARVTNWACVNFCNFLDERDVRNFCSDLVRMCRNTGVDITDLRLPIFPARPEMIDNDLRMRYQEIRNRMKGQKVDLLLAILPEKNGSLYGHFKRICETEIGVMSQCCLSKHVLKSNPQYFGNVAIKINAKAGGRNSTFADIRASLPVVTNKPTVIFGADVTHPAALDDTAPSIASVVASQDWPEVTRYNGVVRAQGARVEIISGLEDIVKELLLAFQRDSKQRPQQLIFYRDGVSEGQFKLVLEQEIPEIEKAWKALYNEKPQITFIVVQKRHHTRLFPNDQRFADRSGNVLAGTVVDRKICHPTEFDFFLCSHSGIKGTSRPTHYHVLRDDNKFTADNLQSLTYNLCYLYTSCTRSVSIAPPAYYAHKLAFRARFYVKQTSEAATTAGSGGRGAPAAALNVLPEIKNELKRFMFYC
ncbi:hypothetical protein ACP4OV_007058 [Aristida adscensionis]